ncbi:MAG: hypothetical protein J5865_09035 [Lachnospiraceae bacterium]|nr:hypothetical protein [Lachnospiraceae bacterium]
MKRTSSIIALVLALILAVSAFTGCGAANVDPGNYSSQVAATIGDDTIYLDEANFFLRYNQWNLESYYWQYYQYMGYANMWAAPAGSSSDKTMATSLKEQVMDELLETRILMNHAEEYKAALTDEDKETVKKAVEDFFANYTEDFFKYARVTEEQLTQWFTNNALAMKVFDAVKNTATVSVEDKDCEVYTVRYVRIADDTDDDGVDAAKAEAEYIVKHVKEDGEKMEDTLTQYGGSTTVESYLLSDESPTADAARIGKTLKTGEIVMEHVESESSSAWYVVYCESDHDEEASAEKRADLEDEQRVEHFNGIYKEWMNDVPAFEVKDCFSDLEVSTGEMIYVAPTAAETESDTEAPSAEESETESQTAG